MEHATYSYYDENEEITTAVICGPCREYFAPGSINKILSPIGLFVGMGDPDDCAFCEHREAKEETTE